MTFAMYFGFSDIVRKSGWGAAADAAVGLGCSSVELFDTTSPDELRLIQSADEAKAAGEVLKSRGLDVACYSVFANLYNSPESVAAMKTHAELAAAIGSPFLHHTVLPWIDPDEPRPAFDAAIDAASDAAAQVADHAADFGITCLYEPQGFYANGVDGFRVFLSRMKRRCKNVGVCADMGNTQFVDVPAEDFFRAFAQDIRHAHVKDYFRKESAERPGIGWYKTLNGAWVKDAPAGDGVVNIDACMEVLRGIGYNGPLSIELPNVKHTINYMKKYE